MKKYFLAKCINQDTHEVHDIWLHFVDSVHGLKEYLDQAISSYKEVFSGPPYFENYEGQEESFVAPLFESFAENGILAFAVTGDDISSSKVIGFGAGISAAQSEVSDFLKDKSHFGIGELEQCLYMAEVGVIESFRRQGLGKHLVLARINEAKSNARYKFTQVIMRTASINSNSASIYKRIGAKIVDGLIQTKEEFGTQSMSRVFMTMPIC